MAAIKFLWVLCFVAVDAQNIIQNTGFQNDDIVIKEVSSDWEKEANERIEKIRKRDMMITVKSGESLNHEQLQSLELSLTENKPGFPFGTCVVEKRIVENSEENTKYSEFVANNFNYAVFENGMKWPQWEPQKNVFIKDKVDAALEWLDSRGITVRGHNVFWEAREEWQPEWVKPLKDEDMWEAVRHRVDTLVVHHKGRVSHWDANNEMLDHGSPNTGSFYVDAVGGNETIRVKMFQWIHETDPDALLFVNDFDIITSAGGLNTDRYIKQIADLRAAGAPIHGIGVQGHFQFSQCDPYSIKEILDKIAAAFPDLPIWMTEFNVDKSPDDDKKADAYEDVLRLMFSHPQVEGILFWGFWHKQIWQPDAALVEDDFTLNAAGIRYNKLYHEEWRTNVDTADGDVEEGEKVFNVRGFHREYDYLLTLNGETLGEGSFSLSTASAPYELCVEIGDGICP